MANTLGLRKVKKLITNEYHKSSQNTFEITITHKHKSKVFF